MNKRDKLKALLADESLVDKIESIYADTDHDPFEVDESCIGEVVEVQDNSGLWYPKRLEDVALENTESRYRTSEYTKWKQARRLPIFQTLPHDGSAERPELMREGGIIEYTGGMVERLNNDESCDWTDVKGYIPKRYL